jgi:hypothetical protein
MHRCTTSFILPDWFPHHTDCSQLGGSYSFSWGENLTCVFDTNGSVMIMNYIETIEGTINHYGTTDEGLEQLKHIFIDNNM